MIRAVTIAWVFVLVTLANPAGAFQDAASFLRPVHLGGASGILHTGSARFRGYDCSMCHQQAAGDMRLELTSDPPELLSQGRYEPGASYTITIAMLGEHRAVGDEGNQNMFVAELVDDQAQPQGVFEEIELSTLQRDGGDVNIDGAVFGATNLTSWQLLWTAPSTGTGRLALHVAAVDGDAGTAAAEPRPPTDPFNDDVFIGRRRLCEASEDCDRSFLDETPVERTSPTAHGCSASGPVTPSGSIWRWGLILGVAISTRARRRQAGRRSLRAG